MLPMFNQGSRSFGALSLDTPTFLGSSGGFTYNESPYVHALNHVLQLECAAISLYAAEQRRSGRPVACERTASHQNAQRQLVTLIFAQRGLPESDPASLVALTTNMAARVARYIPSTVQAPVLGVTAHRVELALVHRYSKLLKVAPPKDLTILESLLEQARDFSAENL